MAHMYVHGVTSYWLSHSLYAMCACELHLEIGGIPAVSRLCLLGQSERKEYCVCCYRCCTSLERINVSVVPMAPPVSF